MVDLFPIEEEFKKGRCQIFGKIVSSLAGPLISAGTALFEGSKNRDQQSKQFSQAQNFDREMAQNSIQYRVEDAKKAGLHPLYAIGANTYSPSSAFVGGQASPGIADAGRHIGQGVSDFFSQRDSQRLKDMQLALLDGQIKETDARADYYKALAAKDRQNTGGLGVMSEVPQPQVKKGRMSHTFAEMPGQQPLLPQESMIEVQPTPQKSKKAKKPGIVSGEHAGYQEFILPGGLPILLPASEEGALAEVMEAVPWYMWPGIIQHNSRFYGDPWLNDFRDFSLWGAESKNVYPRAKDKKKGRMFRKEDQRESPFWKQGKRWLEGLLPSFK